MKIGFDAKRFFKNRTGLGNYSRDLVRIMEQFYPENDYLLYTPAYSNTPYQSLINEKQVRVPHDFLNKTFSSYWRTKGILKDLESDGINIFHGLSGEIPSSLSAKGIKSVVTIHDLIFLRYPNLYKAIDRSIYEKKFNYACHHADQIVAISEQTKQDIIQFFDIPEQRIKVIYQGCHPAFKEEKTAAQKSETQTRLGLPNEFLLNVGTLEERKNGLSILKALESLDFPVVFVGKGGKYKEEMERFVKEKNMTNRVFFLQGLTMTELSILYASATAFVYPSIFEGFGIPIIEALFSGTPVITTAGYVFPEAGGPSSSYIKPSEPEQIKSAIVEVLHSQTKREEMRLSGLEFATRFEDKVIAKQWQQLYKQL